MENIKGGGGGGGGYRSDEFLDLSIASNLDGLIFCSMFIYLLIRFFLNRFLVSSCKSCEVMWNNIIPSNHFESFRVS